MQLIIHVFIVLLARGKRPENGAKFELSLLVPTGNKSIKSTMLASKIRRSCCSGYLRSCAASINERNLVNASSKS